MTSITNNLTNNLVQCATLYLENKDLFDIFIKVRQSPHALELYNRVRHERGKKRLEPVTVKFISKEEAEAIHEVVRGAFIDTRSGVISIRSDQSDNGKLTSFIFELGNLSQQEKIDQIVKDLNDKKFKTGVELARAIEILEFRTNEICNDILYRSAEAGYWDSSMKNCMANLHDFDTFWDEAVETNHAKYYIDFFDKLNISK